MRQGRRRSSSQRPGGDDGWNEAKDAGERDLAWGPENVSSVLQPATRIFEARDSHDSRITACKISRDGRYLVFTQRSGGCSVYELSSGKNLFIRNPNPEEVNFTMQCFGSVGLSSWRPFL